MHTLTLTVKIYTSEMQAVLKITATCQCQYNRVHITQWTCPGLHWKPQDVAIRQVAPGAAKVLNFGKYTNHQKNTTFNEIIYGRPQPKKDFLRQNITHVIDAASFVKNWDAKIGAEELSYILVSSASWADWYYNAGNNWEFLGEKRARRRRELSQILTEELLIFDIWVCK